MGMRDQSWCASCGAGMLYTEDENATCYKCDQEEYNKLETRSSKFMEYMKIHLISLMQDLESLEERMEKIDPNCKDYAELDFEFNWVSGQITATRHLLSVATDIMNASNERVYV
jgi:hypothetical protein